MSAHDADDARREQLVVALTRLSNEVLGCTGMAEAELRSILGNTNYTCLVERANEARALLAASPLPETKP